jgi:H/ACA ribonucleoprotein complex subunit 3
MASEILKCEKCKAYGLTTPCTCGGKRLPVLPPKYSPEDKYASYRRQYKEQLSDGAKR